MEVFDLITFLIVLATVFTYVNHTFMKLPSTIGLMLLSLFLSLVIIVGGNFSPWIYNGAKAIMTEYNFSELLLDILLSFLLFAGALEVDLLHLRKERWTIINLATIGVVISVSLTSVGFYYAAQLLNIEIGWAYCFLFGALIAPTDPISVLAMLKNTKIDKRINMTIAGESLFNDGIGVVLFLTIMQIVSMGTENVTVGASVGLFAQEVFGGIALGLLLGFIGFYALKHIKNDLFDLEILVTLALVLLSNRTAALLHVSSPLAVVVLGIFIGNKGRKEQLKNIAGEYVFKFWHTIDELLNALLFILIGLHIVLINMNAYIIDLGLAAIVITLVARFISVGIPIKIMSIRRKMAPHSVKVLTWGGLRGGISIALALSVPPGPYKDLILQCTYFVVVFSIVVQGLTFKPLLRKLKLLE